jgi:hypothetical protein
VLVGRQLAVDDVGQPAFEGAKGFRAGRALGQLASVVGLPGGGVADLEDRGEVQGVVEPTVAGP